MITGTILTMLAYIGSSLLGILPHISVPSWLADNGSVAKVFQAAGSMGAWFPVALVTTILASLLVIWAASFAIKTVRIVVSVLTGGGGSAA